ncbi:hypothetical protein SLEP1_g45825 [Rubroshorea leprosula]|uniref:Uncharacterized protein n=1 Tax=Rubroshorea leprosula TaxID=152421 RepID=A0AAV5LML9_9ROSI|nr:hypothetical protein SLEP1_g45825 [Rubroshorea leprosula]
MNERKGSSNKDVDGKMTFDEVIVSRRADLRVLSSGGADLLYF